MELCGGHCHKVISDDTRLCLPCLELLLEYEDLMTRVAEIKASFYSKESVLSPRNCQLKSTQCQKVRALGCSIFLSEIKDLIDQLGQK